MSLAGQCISWMRPFVDRFPRLAALYRSVRDQLDERGEAVTTPWGFQLAGNAAMAQGIFEPAETALVRTILQEVDVLVNVGANIGYYCCHALSMGKPVIAFEPMPQNCRYLCRNIRQNGWSAAEVYPIALSDRIGILEIYGGNTGASVVKGWAGTPESYVTLVPSSTMDVVLSNRLLGKKALILVDIEGAEKGMLEGAAMVLANKPKPVWLVEIVTRDHQPSGVDMNPNFTDTFKLFFQQGYKAFLADESLTPITLDEVVSIAQGHRALKTHNFLFRGSEQRP